MTKIDQTTGMSEGGAEDWQPIAGPVDRESFYSAQNRYQQQTRIIKFVCILVVILMGIPLSIITAPLLWTMVLLAVDLINIFMPMPDLFSSLVSYVDILLRNENDWLLLRALIPAFLASLATGAFAFALLWVGVRRMLNRSGIPGILISLGVREPDVTDLKERRLINVVDEMSIAAGLASPKVMLFDLDIPNAAIVGNSVDDAILIVSRKLLDDYNRDETQGIIAQLMGSAGNGDLGISLTILSVFLTMGLATTLLSVSASRRSRRTAIDFIRRVFGRGREDVQEVDLIVALLQADSAGVDNNEDNGMSNKLRAVVRLPLLIVAMAFMSARTVLQLFILGPVLSLLWRNRRYLADATAVQLTRNPDGLAMALQHMVEDGGAVSGGRYLSHLFIVGAEAKQARLKEQYQQKMAGLREEAQGESWAGRVGMAAKAFRTSQQQSAEIRTAAKDSTETQLNLAFPLLPPLEKRLMRLMRMGAHIHGKPSVISKNAIRPRWTKGSWFISALIVGPLLFMLLMMVYVIVALSTMLGMGASMTAMMLLMALLHPLLRML